MIKRQRFYTQFRLPDGNKVTLSFRSKNELNRFSEKYPHYVLLYEGIINPNDTKEMMKANT